MKNGDTLNTLTLIFMQIKPIKEVTILQPKEKVRISNFTHSDIDKLHIAICNQISKENLSTNQKKQFWFRKEYRTNSLLIRRVK